MRTSHVNVSVVRRIGLSAIALLGLLASSAAAQPIHLIAAPASKSVTLPNGNVIAVPVWGFALDANDNGVLDAAEAVTVPGPRITLPPGTTSLSITLTNTLPEPTSIVVLGQSMPAGADVVRRVDGRVESMTKETAPNSTDSYTFANLKPGTFLYESGTHQAVQVQMGLYGAMTLDAAAGPPAEAYAGLPYDHEALVVYSEIDVALHQAVAGGTYGTPAGPTSTINYRPSLYLVNGESYTAATAAIAGSVHGERTLLRLINAGLKSHAPLIDNSTLSLVAEDGNPYPFARTQAAVLLSAGKTQDAIWVPPAAGTYALYDRMLDLTADKQGDGGLFAKLKAAASAADAPPAVTAADQSYAGTEDTPLAVAAAGVLTGATSTNPTPVLTAQLVTDPHAGTVILNADGSFTYTPSANFFGVDSFTYKVNDGATDSQPAMVTISVAGVNDAPVAVAQSFGVDAMNEAHVTLAGTDADGDVLTVFVSQLPANGTLSWVDPATSLEHPIAAADLNATPIPSGLVIYRPNPGPVPPTFSGTDTFQFAVADAAATSAAAQVDALVQPPSAAAVLAGVPLTLTVVGSDGTPVTGYRWTLEEDQTIQVQPGVLDPNTLSVRFHTSHMPVIATGDETTQPIIDPTRRYFVSVLPKSTYTNSGAPVPVGQTAVTVRVNLQPLPTAQIRVHVFEDNAPLNGIWDAVEPGLAGFEVTLNDTAGMTGMAGGLWGYDAYGNRLGTVYGPCSTPPCDGYEVVQEGQGFVLTDADGYALIQNLPPGKYDVLVRPPGGATWVQTSTLEGGRAIAAFVKNNEPQYFTEFGPPGPHAEFGFVRPINQLGTGPGPFSTVSGRILNVHMSRPPDPASYGAAPFDWTRPWVALNTGATGGTLIYAAPVNEDGTFSISGVPSGTYQLWVWDEPALGVIIQQVNINVSAPNPVLVGDVNFDGVLAPNEGYSVFQWNANLDSYAFEDLNENGFRDPGEGGIPDSAANIRWRDGSMYQSLVTKDSGKASFNMVFPFFAWMIAESDFARYKTTGVTVVVDNGGNTHLNTAWAGTVGAADTNPAVLAPQPQNENGGADFRTESCCTSPDGAPLILLEGFQAFLGQTNVLLWGKAPYAPAGSAGEDINVAPFDDFPGPGDTDDGILCPGTTAPLAGCGGNNRFDVDRYNGGITGVVHYSITRAENDPRWGVPEPWEPGIPRVRLQLWDATKSHLLNEVVTDSWDDAQPAGCQSAHYPPLTGDVFSYLGNQLDCYDGMRNFNQVRPAVFDGGYYFSTALSSSGAAPGHEYDLPLDQRNVMKPLARGNYVVKVIPSNGYQVVKEEDKNVDFGEEYIPQQFYLTGYPLADGGVADAQPKPTVEDQELGAPFCVGAYHDVPPTLALFPGAVNGAFGGERRVLCDAKLVLLRDGQNAAANFFLFTEAPIAGHVFGFVLDDTTNESDPNSPQFGEKWAPPFMPISIRDWTGHEIVHTYTDYYGRYNALVPSTFTAATPIPSGMTPQMLTACINEPLMNDPSGSGQQVPDPYFNKQYSHFCYTLPFMPGTTDYLDTPVIPTGAFTGADAFPVDAEPPAQTPAIGTVTGCNDTLANCTALTATTIVGGSRIGPYIVDRGAGTGDSVNAMARRIAIRSMGNTQVPNPYYDGVGGTQPKLITRDYGFGPASSNGIVRLGTQPITVESWTNDQIIAVVPTNPLTNPGLYRTGELTVERCLSGTKTPGTNTCPGDSRKSILGVTLNVANPTLATARPPKIVDPASGPTPPAGTFGSIQAAINAATAGDLILVKPGTYNEPVVMSRPVRLQGWGAPVTTINTVQVPAEGLQAWRDFVGNLIVSDGSYITADQNAILGPPPFTEAALAAALGGEAAGVLVMGKNQPVNAALPLGRPEGGACLVASGSPFNTFNPQNEAYCLINENPGAGGPTTAVWRPNARIDGFSIMGASMDAGIAVNAFNRFIDISNNMIYNNMGVWAGGIRIGHPGATVPLADEDVLNHDVTIHNNVVTQNAGIEVGAGGGGIGIGTGSDRYSVTSNWVAANFGAGNGGGIAHVGLSPNGVIDSNAVIFNESFNQGVPTSGGGMFVGGRPPLAGAITPGSGNVEVRNNLIHGNQVASGDGGGIAITGANGQDIQSFQGPNAEAQRYHVKLFNNIITNNAAGLAGGGIALQDAVYVEIVHNTITSNDSLAVAGAAFVNGAGQDSQAQPAGIVSRGHTPALVAVLGAGYSDPVLVNSIVWQNRSFFWGTVPNGVLYPEPWPGQPNPIPGSFGLIANPTTPYWDLQVLGAAAGSQLHPNYSVLTSLTGPGGANYNTAGSSNNVTTPPAFVTSYFNGARNPAVLLGIGAPVAVDEGGNFIRPQFGPLSLAQVDGTTFWGNRHITTGIGGQNLNVLYPPVGVISTVPGALLFDFDNQARPTTAPHRGADQQVGAPPVTPLPVVR